MKKKIIVIIEILILVLLIGVVLLIHFDVDEVEFSGTLLYKHDINEFVLWNGHDEHHKII